MRTSKTKFGGRRLNLACVALVAIVAPCMKISVAVSATQARPVPTKAELVEDFRTLDKFVDDVFKLDRTRGELSKKTSLSRTEFDSLQNSADNLKRRLSEVQNALRAIVSKLKDAGEWNDIDSRVAESVDPGTRAVFRQNSIKQELEELAANLTGKADELSPPLENLRKRVSTRTGDSIMLPPGAAFGLPAVNVAYHPEPLFTTGVKCSLSHLRYGLSRLTYGAARAGADEAYKCACNIPSGYSC